MNAAAKKQKRYFTVREANQCLPLVRAIVEDIVCHSRDVEERRQRLAAIRQISGGSHQNVQNVYSEELEQVELDLERDSERLYEYIDELAELGVELKDPLSGLVDFPTLMGGREAYLCWKLGEEDVSFWHELDAGFQGRQSLLETSLPGEPAGGEERN